MNRREKIAIEGPMNVKVEEVPISIVVKCSWGTDDCKLSTALFVDNDSYCVAHYNETIKILKAMKIVSQK